MYGIVLQVQKEDLKKFLREKNLSNRKLQLLFVVKKEVLD